MTISYLSKAINTSLVTPCYISIGQIGLILYVDFNGLWFQHHRVACNSAFK